MAAPALRAGAAITAAASAQRALAAAQKEGLYKRCIGGGEAR